MTNNSPLYLDCNATTPLDPRVREVMLNYFDVDYGNEGSRTHEYGTRAKQAVQSARDQVAALVACARDEVIFTSGATESNNIALLGLAKRGIEAGLKHVVSTHIEHKAVLEPLDELERLGFEVTRVAPTKGGWVEPKAVLAAMRPDTLFVSVMHANNESGVIQPIDEIAEGLRDHPAYFHTDAAQTFGKIIETLKNPRLDLISISGHKIYGPKGIGALITRRRGYDRIPLVPLMYGGGQERGLRPGTLPVQLIVGLGMAAQLALKEHKVRTKKCAEIREQALQALLPLGVTINGDTNSTMVHVINMSFCGLDSEAVMLAIKEIIAISNGSACTSSSYKPSHVLAAMGLSEEIITGALRLSWCHMTPDVDWAEVARRIKRLQ